MGRVDIPLARLRGSVRRRALPLAGLTPLTRRRRVLIAELAPPPQGEPIEDEGNDTRRYAHSQERSEGTRQSDDQKDDADKGHHAHEPLSVHGRCASTPDQTVKTGSAGLDAGGQGRRRSSQPPEVISRGRQQTGESNAPSR